MIHNAAPLTSFAAVFAFPLRSANDDLPTGGWHYRNAVRLLSRRNDIHVRA